MTTDRPLVPDRIYGLRTFRVADGKLEAITRNYTFTPGINHAECIRGKEEKEHDTAILDCTCGFYAYNDSQYNPYHESFTNVYGVIAGTGLATVGSRGMRLQNAEIMGLVEPAPLGRIHKAYIRFSSQKNYLIAQYVAWILMVVALVIATVSLKHFTAIGLTLAVLCGLVSNFLVIACGQMRRCLIDCNHNMKESVEAEYPDIPWFASIEELIEKYPSIKNTPVKHRLFDLPS